MDKRSSRDMLSGLPLSIIHTIIALVPIREAVKTSILSRQWRYTWASLPHLVFDDEFAGSKSNTRLCRIINQALFLHKGPVHKFELRVSFIDCLDYLDLWMLFLSRNDIRVLILDFEESDYVYEVHSSLYSCQNLTHLELVFCQITLPPPAFKGLPCLRSLVFENVDAHADAVESLVANCPLLEKLTLNFTCFETLELRICAPNLKYFCVRGDYKEIYLHAPLLTMMSAALHGMYSTPENLQQESSVCNYYKFLGSLSNLEEMNGTDSFIEYLSIGIESCHRLLAFHHLRVIDLHRTRFTDVKQIWTVVRLLTGAPNLHKLKISWDTIFKHESVLASISFCDSENAANIRFERLKVIEMRNVNGFLSEMKLVEFLLASSPVLETLIFNPSSHQNLLNLTVELLSYRRGSTNAQILIS